PFCGSYLLHKNNLFRTYLHVKYDILGGIKLIKTKVDLCGVDTSKLPVLKNDEMRVLFKKIIRNEDVQECRETLVNGNLRLVLSVIQRFIHRGENADDLFQVGCIGLMKSIDNFDLKHNVRFSTYAVPMIIGEIKRYLRDNNPIRVSRSIRDTAYKALRVREKLMNKTQKEPTAKDIAQEMGVPQEDVVFAIDAIQDPVSLFEPIYQEGGEPIYVLDQVSDDKITDETWDDYLSLKEGMYQLNQREKMILTKRFYQGKTQMEVAEEIGISQAQVSRLEKAAIEQMSDDMFT